MMQYINRLSSSGREQSVDGNYGVGAKISAATKNPLGVVYLSWKNGQGAMIHLWRNPDTGEYELKQMKLPSGRYSHWGPVEDALRPSAIKENGTMVALLGSRDADNTIEAPAGVPTPSRWIARYLNSRFFKFPEAATIRAREGWTSDNSDTNVLRAVRVLRISRASQRIIRRPLMSVTLLARLWILKDTDAIGQSSGANLPGGHVAGLYQNELYELVTARSGVARLQSFGVSLGHQRVVIYVQPKESSRRKSRQTQRELFC